MLGILRVSELVSKEYQARHISNVKRVNMVIIITCEELTLGVRYTRRARARNLYLCSLFHARVQTTGCSGVELGGPIVTMRVDRSLWSSMLGDVRRTW